MVTPEELARLKSSASEANSKYALALRAYKRQKRAERKGEAMAVKTTGAEFKKFYYDSDFWPEDSWIDEIELLVDGERNESAEDDVDSIPDASKVAIKAGFVILDKDNTPSLESFFKKWRKEQTTVSFIVECHKDHAEAIKVGIKMMGGTVK